MKRIAVFLTVVAMLATIGVAAAQADEINDPGQFPDGVYPSSYPFADSQTTTRYSPWWTNHHLTTPEGVTDAKRAGEGGQIVMSIAISPHDNQLVFMGTDVSGLHKSIDGGENWFKSDSDLPLTGIGGVAFDPDDDQTIYVYNTIMAPGMSVTQKPNSYFGIYKSTDAGETYEQVLYARATEWRSNDMLFDAAGALYVISFDGIFKSFDKGANWQNLGLQNLTASSMFVHPTDGWIVAASNEQGVHFSPDNGATWEARNSGIASVGGVNPNAWVTVNPEDPSHWVAVINAAVYQSFNQGMSWALLGTAPVLTDGSFHSATAQPFRVHFGPSLSGGDPRLFLVYHMTANVLRVSDDLGLTWNIPTVDPKYDYVSWDKPDPNTGYWEEGIGLDPTDPDIVYFSFNDVVFKSTDGGINFDYSSAGFSGNRAVGFVFDPDDDQKMYVMYTDKGLASYYESNSLVPDYPVLKLETNIPRYAGSLSSTAVALDPRNSDHILASIGSWTNQIIAETNDGGENWSHIPGSAEANIAVIKFHDDDPDVIYGGNLRSDDAGATWTPLSKNIQAVSPYDNDVLYATDATKKIAYRSDDRGDSWYELARLGTSTIEAIYADEADSAEQQTLWLGTFAGRILKVTRNDSYSVSVSEKGETQGLVKYDDLYPTTFEAFAQDPSNPSHMIAAGRNSTIQGKTPGPYESFDGGNTWRVVPGMPGGRDVWAVAFDPHRPRVFMGTSSGTMVYEYEQYDSWLLANAPDPGNSLAVEGRPGTDAGTTRLTVSGSEVESNFSVLINAVGTPLPKTPSEGDSPPAEAVPYGLDTNLRIAGDQTAIVFELDPNGLVKGYGTTAATSATIHGTRHSYEIVASADTFIRGDQMGVLQGDKTTADVRRNSTSHSAGDRVAYYKFELPADLAGTVETANVGLFTTYISPPANADGARLLVHKVIDDNWTDRGESQLGAGETTLLHGYPLPFSLSADQIADIPVALGQPMSGDITSFVGSEADGDGIVTVGLMTAWAGMPTNGAYGLTLATRENAAVSSRPVLRITTVETQAYAPTLMPGVVNTERDIELGDSYLDDLTERFEDYNDDDLTYTVSVDGTPPTLIVDPANFEYTPSTAGQVVLEFTASDGNFAAGDSYFVTLNIAGDYYPRTFARPNAVPQMLLNLQNKRIDV